MATRYFTTKPTALAEHLPAPKSTTNPTHTHTRRTPQRNKRIATKKDTSHNLARPNQTISHTHETRATTTALTMLHSAHHSGHAPAHIHRLCFSLFLFRLSLHAKPSHLVSLYLFCRVESCPCCLVLIRVYCTSIHLLSYLPRLVSPVPFRRVQTAQHRPCSVSVIISSPPWQLHVGWH